MFPHCAVCRDVSVSFLKHLFIVNVYIYLGTKDEFTSMAQYEYRIKSLTGSVNLMKVIDNKNHFEIEAPAYDALICTYIEELIGMECNND